MEVDVHRLEQVMGNLVSNALKFMKQGEMKISLTTRNPEKAIITVEDQGSGISESDIPYVFDRMYTKGKTNQTKGHGLGLAISKEIITAHNGDIWVESKEGFGSRFSFSMNVFDADVTDQDKEIFELSK